MSVSRGWQGLSEPAPISKPCGGWKRNLPEMHQPVIRCAYTGLMETNTTFTHNGITYKVMQIKTHSDQFTAQLGWSHFAELKRGNGRRAYLANLNIVDGVVAQMKVVM